MSKAQFRVTNKPVYFSDALEEDCYYKILTQSDILPLQEFINKVEFHGDSVIVDDKVILEVTKYAAKSDLGVHAIRQILKKLFIDILFLVPGVDYKTHHIKYKKEDFYE